MFRRLLNALKPRLVNLDALAPANPESVFTFFLLVRMRGLEPPLSCPNFRVPDRSFPIAAPQSEDG
jgi:hypothetical protein